MSTADSSTPPDPSVLLRLSACTNLTQLAAALDELAMDPAAILAAVPECLDSRGLAALLFNHASEQQLSEDDEWAYACVARAEAVDRWTGRIDWAVQWLEAVKERSCSHISIDEALQRAVLLQSVVVGEQGAVAYLPATSAVTLADLNAMAPDVLVAWAMARVGEWPDLADAVLEALQLDTTKPGEPLIRTAWNRWWARNMVGSSHGLLRSLVVRYPRLFDMHVVLAAIYAVGGPCSDIYAANEALGVLVRLVADGRPSSSDTVQFPESIWRKIQDAQPESFESLAPEETVIVLNTALAQVDAGETLARLGLDIDMPTVAACQQGADDQQRLLVKLILSALRLGATRPEGVSLWPELVRLHSTGLFSCIPLESIKKEYLQRLLSGEQFEQAQVLIDAQPPFTGTHVVRDAVCQAACEMFDNAESGNMDAGLVRSASQCLDLLSAHIQRNDPIVMKERALIDAAHLVWTLGASGLSAIFKSSDRATAASGEVLPIEIRLSSDPYALLKDILARTPGGYKKQRVVREIAGKLLEIAALAKNDEEPSAASDSTAKVAKGELPPSRRDLGVHSISEALVAALLLEAATNSSDYSAAYDYARQLVNARPVLAKAQGATETHRSRQLLGSSISNSTDNGVPSQAQPVQLEVRAIECIWRACVELATKWGTSDQLSVVRERRLEVTSLALGLCPTSEIPRILRLWNQIQADHLTDAPEANDALPWAESQSLDHIGKDPVAIVHETLVGSTAAVLPAKADTSPTTAADPGNADAMLDLDAVRTFDAAIIKRSLRQTLGAAETQRRELLLEWLDFALTTSKRPKDDGDAAFRRRMEAEVAKRYPQEAIGVLVVRVLPHVDQTNYAMLEPFYTFYARCAKAAGDAESEQQALVRLALVKQIMRDTPKVVQKMRFADVVAPFVCASEAECRAMVSAEKQAFWPGDVGELVALASELAKLRPLSGIEEVSNKEDDRWAESGSVLGSKLCLWALTDIAASGDASEQFNSMFVDCLSHMSSAEDVCALAGFLAFSGDASRSLSPDSRYHGVSLCCEQATNNGSRPLPRLAKDAQAYMEYVSGLCAIHDPFMFAGLPDQWAQHLDVCASQSGWEYKDKPPAECVVHACIDVVSQMAADESVGAYFVCECYVRVQDLADKLDAEDVQVPELSQLYVRVIQNTIDEHKASDYSGASGTLGQRLKAIAEPPMELSGFDFGDGSALGAVMQKFKTAFGTALVDLAHSDVLDSSARLALLEAVDQHSLGVSGDSKDEQQQKQEAPSSDFLHFCLLADKHWGVKIEQSLEARSIEGRCTAWLALLQSTSAEDEQLVDVLVALLVKWAATDNKQQSCEADRCVSALIEWGVRNQAPRCVVRAIIDHGNLFTQIAGSQAFGALVADARRDPSIVAPLATLGLAYPSDVWAEQCMELVVYAMAAAESASAQEPSEAALGSGDEDNDAWDIDDDDLLLESGDEPPPPPPAEYGRAGAMIVDSAALHVAIAAQGYVAACAGSPRLVEALGRTLINAATVRGLANNDDQALVDALAARAGQQEMALLAPGMQPAHELLRRAIHAAHGAGMRDQALAWIYELVGLPAPYRFAASAKSVERWIAHVDRLVLGEGSKEDKEEKQLTTIARLAEAEKEEAVVDDGWGDDDIDLDADLENL
ncbi:hypothetical protein LPJ59_000112 [Coemansia sp. RSA 2399]|nr:hypothetical protein LPJ59_000112 [Coemansia sp. RSA 2399]KAJ1908394.1 hypothetical protein LPJ81_000103 [Coemansia sp. IMI 209127]